MSEEKDEKGKVITASNFEKSVERLFSQLNTTQATESKLSESAEAIAEMNRDSTDDEGMREIDFKTDITHNQAVILTRLDSIARLGGIFTQEDVEMVTRMFQRKMVSLKRKGRGEAIELHRSVTEKTDGRGFWEKWFSPKE